MDEWKKSALSRKVAWTNQNDWEESAVTGRFSEMRHAFHFCRMTRKRWEYLDIWLVTVAHR